jgi:hypothetical protein
MGVDGCGWVWMGVEERRRVKMGVDGCGWV